MTQEVVNGVRKELNKIDGTAFNKFERDINNSFASTFMPIKKENNNFIFICWYAYGSIRKGGDTNAKRFLFQS